MTKRKEVKGVLYFSDHEPRIIGHLEIAGEHFELVGIRRSDIRTDLSGQSITTEPEPQGDLFDDGSCASGDRKCGLV
jgi:hypothetical protein